ncbi:hypothetical protein E2C01_062714 [Portunus trituberculatus]|uniref:Uncharacterized protein n=1 Tax=Portunus trituberculatus TaxID=210409 RepID=A0A5B7HBU6_PORTR|nr:hypothetical protein [Portunus trituberculatus]
MFDVLKLNTSSSFVFQLEHEEESPTRRHCSFLHSLHSSLILLAAEGGKDGAAVKPSLTTSPSIC